MSNSHPAFAGIDVRARTLSIALMMRWAIGFFGGCSDNGSCPLAFHVRNSRYSFSCSASLSGSPSTVLCIHSLVGVCMVVPSLSSFRCIFYCCRVGLNVYSEMGIVNCVWPVLDICWLPQPNATRLRGRGADFRLRVGDWRVIYSLDDESEVLLVAKIDQRGQVYR